MKTELYPHPAVRTAIDDCLSGVSALPSQRLVILRKARGDVKMKRKLSLGLVLVMALILMAATAVAVVSIRELARNMAHTEKEQGYFARWEISKKKEAIQGLVKLGYIQESEETKQVLDAAATVESAHQLADGIMTAFTGQDAGGVSFLGIMQAVWGPAGQWSHEQKAWHSQLMADVGENTEGKTFYVEPSGPINESEAIAIARREVAKGYDVPESALDAYLVQADFEIPEANEPDDRQAWWRIAFSAPEGMGADERLFISFSVFVHPETGRLMQTVEEMLARRAALPLRPDNSLYQAIDRLWQEAEQMGHWHFRTWPIELKARYSQEITPRVQEMLKTGDLSWLMNAGHPDLQVIVHSSFLYGLPGEKDIPQEEAFGLAKAALSAQFGIPAEFFDLYSEKIVCFDVTDPERPLWKFLFNAGALRRESLEGRLDNPLIKLNYKAELCARTGRVVKLEEFPFRHPGWDLAYDMKLY